MPLDQVIYDEIRDTRQRYWPKWSLQTVVLERLFDIVENSLSLSIAV